MTKEIENAIEIAKKIGLEGEDEQSNLGEDFREALQALLSLAQLFVEAQKGMPEKKHWLPKNDLDNLEVKGFNSAIVLCTAHWAKKMERLEEFLMQSMLPKQLIQAIREYLMKG